MKSLFVVLLICALGACPALSMSRWFSATYNDLKFTLFRYGYCYSGLQPLSSANLNPTQYLVHQMKNFLDQGNYDNEQLANVTALMDGVCRTQSEHYTVSMHINVSQYEGDGLGKENRCQAIEEAMNAMYYVFRKAALNRSEPLDFSSIQFYPNATDKSASYGVVDLINVSWIKSMIDLERFCNITNSVKDYVSQRTGNLTAQARAEPSSGPLNAIAEMINRLLDPILGLQERLYWESSNRLGQIQSGISSGFSSVRSGIGSGVSRTRQRLFGSRTNSTSSSSSAMRMNSTNPFNSTTNGTPKPLSTVGSTTLNATTFTATPNKNTTLSSLTEGKLTNATNMI